MPPSAAGRAHELLAQMLGPQAAFRDVQCCRRLTYSGSQSRAGVSSAFQTGGTWAGAIENLRAGWVPLAMGRNKVTYALMKNSRRASMRFSMPQSASTIRADG